MITILADDHADEEMGANIQRYLEVTNPDAVFVEWGEEGLEQYLHEFYSFNEMNEVFDQSTRFTLLADAPLRNRSSGFLQEYFIGLAEDTDLENMEPTQRRAFSYLKALLEKDSAQKNIEARLGELKIPVEGEYSEPDIIPMDRTRDEINRWAAENIENLPDDPGKIGEITDRRRSITGPEGFSDFYSYAKQEYPDLDITKGLKNFYRRASSEFREPHMTSVIDDEMEEYEDCAVVTGVNHAPHLADDLMDKYEVVMAQLPGESAGMAVSRDPQDFKQRSSYRRN